MERMFRTRAYYAVYILFTLIIVNGVVQAVVIGNLMRLCVESRYGVANHCYYWNNSEAEDDV